MQIKIIEAASSQHGMELLKKSYGSDCLIISNISTKAKNIIVFAIENETKKINATSSNTSNRHVEASIKTPHTEESVKTTIANNDSNETNSESDNFRDVLNSLSKIKFDQPSVHADEIEALNEISQDIEDSNKAPLSSSFEQLNKHVEKQEQLNPNKTTAEESKEQIRPDQVIDDEYDVNASIEAAALDNIEMELSQEIDRSGAERDREEQFAKFKASMSVNALELTALLQSTVESSQKKRESSNKVINFKKKA